MVIKAAGSDRRLVTREPPTLTWPSGSGRDGEERGRGVGVILGQTERCWGRPWMWEGWGRRAGRITGDRKKGLAQRDVTGNCKWLRGVEGVAQR